MTKNEISFLDCKVYFDIHKVTELDVNSESVISKFNLYNTNDEYMGAFIHYSLDSSLHSKVSTNGGIVYLNEKQAKKMEHKLKDIREKNKVEDCGE